MSAAMRRSMPTSVRLGAKRGPMRVRASATAAVASPPRVVPATLPKVYVYDHCPFCVKVRLALGLKNVKHEVVFMANDDIPTPTALIGKKIAPILERPEEKMIMGESLDIIAYFDEREEFGATGMFGPATGRADTKAWMKGVKDLLRLLHRPRYMQAALPEFQQKDSRDYFVFGHPVPPFDKPEWKAEEFGQEKRDAEYAKAMAQTPELLPQLNAALAELEGLIYCEDYCSEGGLSYDDIDLWARLRSVTLVKGAVFGPKTTAYLENLSARGDIPLYFGMAC